MKEYIEREAAMRFNFSITAPLDKKIQVRDAVLNTMMKIVSYIEAIPTADVAPVRHGRWIETEQPCGWNEVMCAECSECGEDFVLGEYSMADLKSLFRYCPNCGAKMDGGVEDGE